MSDPCSVKYGAADQLRMDFAQFCRYEQLNASVGAPTDHRVIYLGDSITDFWGQRVPGLKTDDVINRGISGQTTMQMLVRFRADVLRLQPKVVHIIAGTNDLAGNTGPTSLQRIANNITSMVEAARAQGVKVVLGSVPPSRNYFWNPEVGDPRPAIKLLNDWLREFAAQEHIVFVDYHAALDDGQGGMKPGVSDDGVHPNAAGYAIMAPLARQALAEAMNLP